MLFIVDFAFFSFSLALSTSYPTPFSTFDRDVIQHKLGFLDPRKAERIQRKRQLHIRLDQVKRFFQNGIDSIHVKFADTTSIVHPLSVLSYKLSSVALF